MIPDVDRALASLLESRVAAGQRVDVAFEPPTREWAAGRNVPTIDAYLYEIREEMTRREYGVISIRDESGAVVQRRRPMRYFQLSYLVTCWTKRTEDEHRLLASALGCLLDTEVLPLPDSGDLAALGLPVLIAVAEPRMESRSPADLWSALGGNLKPSLDVVVTAPFPTAPTGPVAPPVTEARGVIAHRTDIPGPAGPVRLRPVSR